MCGVIAEHRAQPIYALDGDEGANSHMEIAELVQQVREDELVEASSPRTETDSSSPRLFCANFDPCADDVVAVVEQEQAGGQELNDVNSRL